MQKGVEKRDSFRDSFPQARPFTRGPKKRLQWRKRIIWTRHNFYPKLRAWCFWHNFHPRFWSLLYDPDVVPLICGISFRCCRACTPTVCQLPISEVSPWLLGAQKSTNGGPLNTTRKPADVVNVRSCSYGEQPAQRYSNLKADLLFLFSKCEKARRIWSRWTHSEQSHKD